MIADAIRPESTYFKRYRMEIDLLARIPPVPALPEETAWVPWNDDLLTIHADLKAQCFADGIDRVVFPNLGDRHGCLRLMREIRGKRGFRPEATWLLQKRGEYIGTIQGVAEPAGFGSIQNVGVLPAHRGRGLGAALVLQALHGFRRAGLAMGRLEVTADNAAAVRIYRRLGFHLRKTLYKSVEPAVFAMTDWCV